MKTLLIISGGTEAVPGIQIAKEMGLHIIVSDGDQSAPGFNYCDDKIVSSTYDINGTIQKARFYNDNVRKIDGVISIASDVPLTVASVAHKLGLPSIPLQTAKISMDKVKMKESFVENNIPCPEFKLLTNFDELSSAGSKWGFPCVIKPIDSRGARGVIQLREDVDLNWAYNYSMEMSPSKKVMIEKFLDGPQISSESIITNYTCYTTGMSDRNYEHIKKYYPFIIENGGDLPSRFRKDFYNDLNDLITRISKSFNIKNGVIKGDIVIHNNRPYVIEMAPRLSGGYFSTNKIYSSTGVKFLQVAIQIALGESVSSEQLHITKNENISQRYLFVSNGTVKKITGLNKLKNNKNIIFYNITVKPGDNCYGSTSHASRGGMVISRGSNREEAIKFAEDAIASIKIKYA